MREVDYRWCWETLALLVSDNCNEAAFARDVATAKLWARLHAAMADVLRRERACRDDDPRGGP